MISELQETQVQMFVFFLIRNVKWSKKDAVMEGDIIRRAIEAGKDEEHHEFYIRVNRAGSFKMLNRSIRRDIRETWRNALEHGYYEYCVNNGLDPLSLKSHK